jgi:CHAT domain-containing protein
MNDSSNSVDTVQALLSAGVPQVVASRWQVDSKATAELMDSMYNNLSATHDIQKSLHLAAINLSRTRPHPHFWAAFSLFGKP